MLRKLYKLVVGKPYPKAAVSSVNQRLQKRQNLIHKEAAIGATVLGPIPEGHNRDFFCLDEYTWIWYEEWKDEHGRTQNMTVSYEVQPRGILKKVDGNPRGYLAGQELTNLLEAMKLYYTRVATEVYGRQLVTA